MKTVTLKAEAILSIFRCLTQQFNTVEKPGSLAVDAADLTAAIRPVNDSILATHSGIVTQEAWDVVLATTHDIEIEPLRKESLRGIHLVAPSVIETLLPVTE